MYKQGRQFLSRSGGDEGRDLLSFADFSLALSYIILKCKVWTLEGGGVALRHAPGQFRSKVYIYNSAGVFCHLYIIVH